MPPQHCCLGKPRFLVRLGLGLDGEPLLQRLFFCVPAQLCIFLCCAASCILGLDEHDSLILCTAQFGANCLEPLLFFLSSPLLATLFVKFEQLKRYQLIKAPLIGQCRVLGRWGNGAVGRP